MIKWGIFYFPVVTHTILIADHDIDRPPDRDRLADRESNGVANIFPIAVACRGPHQHMVRHTLFRSRSLVVVRTNLFAITYLIADQDLDRLADRDYIPDCRL